jgi:hypothetical protein
VRDLFCTNEVEKTLSKSRTIWRIRIHNLTHPLHHFAKVDTVFLNFETLVLEIYRCNADKKLSWTKTADGGFGRDVDSLATPEQNLPNKQRVSCESCDFADYSFKVGWRWCESCDFADYSFKVG